MFTIKLYNGQRQRILSAESFTILRDDPKCGHTGQRPELRGGAEITLHQKNPAEDRRYDIGDPSYYDRPSSPKMTASEVAVSWPEIFDKAIIENAAGRTTEIIQPIPF